MDRINGADTIDLGGGRRGFRNENLSLGIAGTEVTADHLNGLQEELMKVIIESGLVPNSSDWTQIWQALQILGLSYPALSQRWLAVVSITLTAPPETPAAGNSYLVPTGATGAWSSHAGKIAQWTGSQWSYLTPPNGHGLSLPDGRIFERIDGAYIEKIALDVQSGKWTYTTAGGSANALTATLSPTPSSLIDGMEVRLRIAATTTTAAPTLNLNGLGAKSITNPDGSALTAGALAAGAIQTLCYSSSLDNFVLLTPANSAVKQGTGWIRHSDGTYEAWGVVTFYGATKQVDVTLPVTFPTSVDSVLVTDTGAGVFPGAGTALSNSQIRCFVQPFIINTGTGAIQAKSNDIVLYYRVWGK